MRTLLLILVMTVGCGLNPLGPGVVQEFDRFGGCADVVFYAVDVDDEILITFRAADLVAAAREAGVETTTVVTFPSDDAQLVIEQGSRISDAICDDVIENGGPQVRRSWAAVAGTATVRIRPREESEGGLGDLVLDNVTFRAPGRADFTLETLEWEDVSVGWFPG